MFYTGALRFVYDCGSDSTNNVTSAVCRYYRATCDDTRIKETVVFLSHLHMDHVSGLKTFLDLISVQHVVMPYIRPAERLLVACASIDMPTWYRALLRDPVGFFLKNGVNKVTLIKGGSAKHNGSHGRDARGEGATDFLDLSGLADLEEREVQEVFDLENEVGNDWSYWSNEGSLIIKNHGGNIKYCHIWEFVPFCYEVEEQYLEKFRRCISDRGFNFSQNFIRALESKHGLKGLKGCYTRLLRTYGSTNDLNLTTMALWHGPSDSEAWEIKWGIGNCYADDPARQLVYSVDQCTRDGPGSCSLISALSWRQGCGQLLTGDLNLNKSYRQFREHIGDRLERTVICLVPHHGSANSWNEIILGDARWCKAWIVSAGRHNRYSHPARSVICDIVASGRTLFWTHECAAVVVVDFSLMVGDDGGAG